MARAWQGWWAIVGVMLLAAALQAAEVDTPAAINDLMQDRKYAEAIAAIDKRLADKQGQADQLLYLKGRAQHLANDYVAAVTTFDVLLKDHPKSALARRARFAKGLAFARQGDFRAAELIYKAEAQYVLSLERKQEIANIYLEFADSYFKPSKVDVAPDFTKALEFYTKALEVGPQTEKRTELELRIAQCKQNLGQHAEAAALLTKFIKDHPQDALVIDARFRLGQCQFAQGQLVEARRTWQDLLQLHVDAKSDRLAEAAFELSSTYGLPTPGHKEDLSQGVASLNAFLEKYPEHKLAGAAHLRIVQSYLHLGRYEDAIAAAKKYLADPRFAKRDETPVVQNLLGLAYKVQGKFDEALAAYTEFLAKHPTHSAWAQVQQEIINVEFLKGQAAYDAKKYDQARELWTAFLTKYPLDARNAGILYRFGQMKFQEEKWNEATDAWRQLVSKYPGSAEASQAQFMIAATLEEKEQKFEEALQEYRKVTWGNYASGAQRRVGRLTAKAMKISTDRVVRSGETPYLTLKSRNVESVTVRAYSVDLETYFRKMHLAQGIEKLDISLIDPDATFEFKVPEYQPFQESTHRIEIPLPSKGDVNDLDGGVMAVTVSSKTLEATSLVLQSDLDIIVKSSRDEVFVFAENLKTGKPWPNARILISNGQKVFAEGTTGEDGVFQKSFKELQTSEDVRVFAVSGRHSASNMVGLSGIGVSEGLTDKGYIYTDRPAYRAGQLVHVRGVLRKVAGDRYTVATGKEYQVDVYDNRNRLVFDTSVKLSAFGSLQAHFTLPIAVPQGQYRILVHDTDKESYEGSFIVHEYQLEPVRLEVDTQRTVFYRGEEISGKIKASYYYGAPLVGKEIRYRLADGRIETATTDERGEVPFKLATREFRESQPLTLSIELPERNLATGKTFFLATQGFTLDATTPRDTYLAGETFEVTLHSKDAEQKPLEQALVLQVLQRTQVDGKTGEVEVGKHELKTDAKSGLVRKTLRLEKGGEYVLRISGVDRFKNEVTYDKVVTISDDQDATRLRILADDYTFKVGDKASVVLHWRDDPALALVTFQGARILDYKLVALQKGANKLELPLTAELAPNFELAVAVMTDARLPANAKPDASGKLPVVIRFHEAASPFAVERDLRVKVDYALVGGEKRSLVPGDEIEATITTTDPQGRPLSAEASVALIEQSLLERFPWQVSAIDAFFRDRQRVSAMRTTSSVSFAYHPATHPINARLLAEKDRLEIADEEKKRLEELARVAGGEVREEVALEALEAADNEDVIRLDPAEPAVLAANVAALNVELSDLSSAGQNGQAQGQLQQSLQSQMEFSMAGTNAQSFTKLYSQAGGQGGGGVIGGVMLGYATTMGRPAVDATNNAPTPEFVNNFSVPHWGMLTQNGKAVPLPELSVERFGTSSTKLSGLQLRAWYDHDVRDVQVLSQDGRVTNYNLYAYFGEGQSPQRVEQFVAQMQKEGALVLPQFAPQETGYWNPTVVTDAQGVAKVKFTLPQRSTAWSLLVKAITTETLAGEAEAKFTVKKELFGQLKLPLAFTDGDTAKIQASIHNDALEKGELTVSLKTTLGGKSTTLTRAVKVEKKGIVELEFDQAFVLPEDAPKHGAPATQAEFELTVTAGDRTDVLRQSLPIEPFGVPVFAIEGGAASGDTTAVIEPPKGVALLSPRLQIIVGPSVDQTLLDALFSPATWCQADLSRIAAGTDVAASDLLAGLALQQLVGKSRDANNPQATEIDARIRSSISLLISLQNDDGGWSWGGKSGASDRYSSSRVLWALSAAKAAGYRVSADELAKAVNFVQTQLTAARTSDFETRAALLHALTMAGKEDVTLVNQLYRNRQSLSPMAVVQLSLALVQMDRKQTAAEMLALLDKHNFDEPQATTAGKLAWNQASAELRALYALALDQLTPGDARLTKQIDWLMAHRTGHRWSPDKATGPALQVLCRWYARTRFQGEKYKLSIFVNDLLAKEVEFAPDARTQTIDIAEKFLKLEKPNQRVRFEIGGRGRFTYQCVLGGFVPGDKLVSTATSWKVDRLYEPALLELYGESIPRGFDVLSGYAPTFRNELSELPVAKRGRVELHVYRPGLRADTADEQLEYLVITEPIPAGSTVIENSISGNFDRYELTPTGITFYVGARRQVGTIGYDLHGYLPGKYRATPTIVRNAYRPDQMAVSKPQSLTVLALGAKSSDKYRLSPRELYELGKRHFDRNELALAAPHLQELFANWQLGGDFYKDTVRMLLDVSLAANKPAETVKYFEIIIEKFPDVELPFAKFMQAGDAYHQIGEYERSYLVFRAVIEASFLRESRVAGFLQEQGEFLRSVDVMSKLLAEYPTEPYVAAAYYALAQNIYAKAPQASADVKLREKHVTRVDLIRQAWQRLDRFLTENPDDPAADQASFSVANALLDLELYEKAIERCQKYALRYAGSDYLDSYWYIIGFCHYARGEVPQALEMCAKVASATRIEKGTGRKVESPNKWRAIYILGQIHHSLGEAEAAMAEYARVEDRFEDAREAIAFFAQKGIKLPEVTTLKPGDPVKLELKYRNVPTVDVTVYRIDLMKFSLLRRSLQEFTQINLAGIRPLHEETVKLGDGKDFREKTSQLNLPVKEEGAYLVVCRGGELYSSGMLVVSPLVAEVQEEVEAGRVRTTIRDVVKDRYVHDVHVKVIGSRNDEFVAGETDLRGLNVADGIQGQAMVIAQAPGGRYAFFRGTRELGPPPVPSSRAVQTPAQEIRKPSKGGKDDLLNDLQNFNRQIQVEQMKCLSDIYQNGVDKGFNGNIGGGLLKK